MVSVTMLYFAGVRDRIGRGQETLEFPAATSDAEILRRLAAIHPDAAGLLACSRVAVDQDFVRGAVALRAGSEVAVIPPVSGG
jgi:molybdopterin synthase sulfur carrier subunit